MKNNKFKHWISNRIKLISLFSVLLILSSCFSIKPSSTKSGKNYFETFYVGDNGTQYFIKPFLFNNNILDENLLLDITFRYKNELKDSSIINFSIKSSVIYKSVDSIKISNNLFTVKNNKIELLFNEKTKSGFLSRFSTKISLKETKELFQVDTWEMLVFQKNKSTKYEPNKKTKKAINIMRDKVFILM
jgi:hypothetical protein